MKSQPPTLQELPIPATVLGDPGAVEVLSAWVAHEGLHVAMAPAFDDPGMWGMLLADVARHAARALAAEKVCSSEEAIARIRAMFDAELTNATDPGKTEQLKRQ